MSQGAGMWWKAAYPRRFLFLITRADVV